MGHLCIVEFLIKNKANIDAKSKENKSPLYFAAQGGHIDVIYFLIDNGANSKDGIDNVGYLHWSCKNGYLKIVELLFNKNVGINDQDGMISIVILDKHLFIMQLKTDMIKL